MLIPAEDICDEDPDCPNFADEEIELCFGEVDSIFACDNGVEIPADRVCDGEDDCADASDELATNCVDSG